MINRYDCELRILLDPVTDDMTRGQMLEMDFSLIATDDPEGYKLCSVLHGAAMIAIRSGRAQFRTGEQIPFGLLHAWICAENDEQVCEAGGICYRGPLARVVHVAFEMPEIEASKC